MNQELVGNPTLEKIIETVSKQLSINKEKVTLSSKFTEDLGADSLDRVNLIIVIEEIFNCEIEQEDANKLISVRDLLNYLEQKVIVS